MNSLDRVIRRIYNRWFRPDLLTELRRRGLIVGRNFSMQSGTSIDWSHCQHITIGDDVTMARNVMILAHDASTMRHLGYTRIGKVDIGDRVFIGASSIVLPGVRIGSDVVIGAGSVVSRDIADNLVVCGNPAGVLGSTDEWLERKRSEMAAVPCFGEEYTIRQDVTEAMKAEMNDRMVDRIGYVR
jgi:maltose O-acetyltransferase